MWIPFVGTSAVDPEPSAGIQFQQLRVIRPAIFEKSLFRPLLSKSISHQGLFSGMFRQYGEEHQLFKITPYSFLSFLSRQPRQAFVHQQN